MADARPPQRYTVPAGKQPKRCEYCPEFIYFIRVPKTGGGTRWVPVHCNPKLVDGGKIPTTTEHGTGVNHWTNCAGRDRARQDHPRPTKSGPAQQRELAVDHKSHRCIFCMCTAVQRCSIPRADIDPADLDAYVGRYDVIGPAQLPETVSCFFVQLEPPVCSNPECQRKWKTDAPIGMRLRAGVRGSEANP